MSYSIDAEGLLQGPDVSHQLTGKHSGSFANNLPDTLLMHYTAGSTLAGAVSHLSRPAVKASAHLVLGRDGDIVQLVPFTKKAWHAGKSHYQQRTGLNQYSIGIEMVNAGPLKKTASRFVSAFGKHYSEDEVVLATHRNEQQARYWQVYSEPQIACAMAICEVLIEHYGIHTLLGHEEVSPGRKTDPGPAFPLDQIRQQLLSDRAADDPDEPESLVPLRPQQGRDARVMASQLNIRQSASLYARPVRPPLISGQSVTVLAEKNGWCKVQVTETGWVKKEYLSG